MFGRFLPFFFIVIVSTMVFLPHFFLGFQSLDDGDIRNRTTTIFFLLLTGSVYKRPSIFLRLSFPSAGIDRVKGLSGYCCSACLLPLFVWCLCLASTGKMEGSKKKNERYGRSKNHGPSLVDENWNSSENQSAYCGIKFSCGRGYRVFSDDLAASAYLSIFISIHQRRVGRLTRSSGFRISIIKDTDAQYWKKEQFRSMNTSSDFFFCCIYDFKVRMNQVYVSKMKKNSSLYRRDAFLGYIKKKSIRYHVMSVLILLSNAKETVQVSHRKGIILL